MVNPYWSAWGDTHTGRQRDNNEDRIHYDAERGIFVVVDGMGGEAAGEEAAQHALDCIRKRLEQKTGTPARRIREAITAANNEVYRLAQARPQWRGMACVLTAAVIEDGGVHIGHVGDTRLYFIRGGEIRKITSDHSPVGRQEDAGELHELEAMRHPRRNEVFRDVGSAPHSLASDEFIDYVQVPFEPDSAFLICSDGLTDMVTSAEILRVVTRNAGDPRQTVQELIETANAAGGKDNVSVILVEGENFAPATLRHDATAATSSGPGSGVVRALTGRWSLFLYGLALGAVLLSLLPARFSVESPVLGGAPPETVPERPPLVVEPGSAELPTITKALEKARAGDRIVVASGEYNEAIRLKNGVAVVARRPGEVVIRVAQQLGNGAAAVTAEGVEHSTISGVVIRPDPGVSLPVGMRIHDSDVEVSDIEVSGTTRAGIWIEGNSRSGIAGSYIHSNLGSGIVALGSSAPRLTANVIVRNGAARDQKHPGIEILEQSSPEVVRNVICENAAEGIRVARPALREQVKNNFFTAGGKTNKAGAIGVARP